MRKGILEALGRTVTGVIVKERGADDTPHTQVFLVFRDGTQLEIYGWAGGIGCGGGVVLGGWRRTLEYMPDCQAGWGLLDVTPDERPEGTPAPVSRGFRPNPDLADFVAEMARAGLLRVDDRLTVRGDWGRQHSIPFLVSRYEPVPIVLGPGGLRLDDAD